MNRFRSTLDCHLASRDIRWYNWNFGDQAQKCAPTCSHQYRKHRDQWVSRQQENSSNGR